MLSVLETILADKEYLVGDRVSYADLAFVPWNWLLEWLPSAAGWRTEFPKVAEWDRKLNALESVKTAVAARAEAMKSL